MNLDPFNEFSLLRKRQEKQFEYLKKVRNEIDPRISDEDIMTGHDYGLDVVMVSREFINKLKKDK